MNDSISVWQVLPVLCPDLTASYHPAQLLLDLVCEMKDAKNSDNHCYAMNESAGLVKYNCLM